MRRTRLHPTYAVLNGSRDASISVRRGLRLLRALDKMSTEGPHVGRDPHQGDTNSHDDFASNRNLARQGQFHQRFGGKRSFHPVLPHQLIPPWGSTGRRGLRDDAFARDSGVDGVNRNPMQIQYRLPTRVGRFWNQCVPLSPACMGVWRPARHVVCIVLAADASL
jgi:hypothetical protein